MKKLLSIIVAYGLAVARPPTHGFKLKRSPRDGGRASGSIKGGTSDGEGNPSPANCSTPAVMYEQHQLDLNLIAILSPLSCHVEPLWLAVRFARRRLWGNTKVRSPARRPGFFLFLVA
jgi:hypothetical protein